MCIKIYKRNSAQQDSNEWDPLQEIFFRFVKELCDFF